MGKKCLTCSSKKLNNDEIPEWVKKAGEENLLPSILTDKYDLEKKNSLKKYTPKITDNEVEITIKDDKNSWILYWASNPYDRKKPALIEDAEKSYDNYDNHGLIKTDSSGEAKIVLNCPQIYKVEDVVYPRHVHYAVEDKKVWSKKIRTYSITCKIEYEDLKEIMKSKNHIILNALSKDSFHIPGSYNLDTKSLDTLSKKKKRI